MWSFGTEKVPFIPVDVVCRYIISQSFHDYDSDDAFDSDEDDTDEGGGNDAAPSGAPCITALPYPLLHIWLTSESIDSPSPLPIQRHHLNYTYLACASAVFASPWLFEHMGL